VTTTLAAIIDVASNVGLPVLFVLIAVETMGVPVPGETALVTAAIVASKGRLPIEGVIAVAAAAAILGDNVGFAIGRRYGRRLLTADGPFKRHRARVIEIGEPFFDRHGPKAVFLGRWVSGLRITAAWMAGANRMGWPVFTFYNALGGIAWATSVGLAAYCAGGSAEKIIHTVGIAGAGAAVAAGLGIYLVLRRRRRRAEGLVESAVDRAEERERARGGDGI
jgi:membrane protein DedA with SNARE-associated domain